MDSDLRMACVVYGLYDPRTGELRYIGKTVKTLRVRVQEHVSEAERPAKTHKERWIRLLLNNGVAPVGMVIETVLLPELLYGIEQKWISWARSVGARLANLTDGGPGCLGLILSSEARAKISAVHKGREQTLEHRAKNSAGMKARWRDLEYRRRQESVPARGVPLSADHRAKISAATKGKRKRTSGDRSKHSATICGQKRSMETRQKISSALRGRSKSPEHIEKMRVKAKAWWEQHRNASVC